METDTVNNDHHVKYLDKNILKELYVSFEHQEIISFIKLLIFVIKKWELSTGLHFIQFYRVIHQTG